MIINKFLLSLIPPRLMGHLAIVKQRAFSVAEFILWNAIPDKFRDLSQFLIV